MSAAGDRSALRQAGSSRNVQSTSHQGYTRRKGAKENRVPAAELGAVLAGAAAAVGWGLLKRVHSRSCDLARQLSETLSELETRSSQLSEVLGELKSARDELASTSGELEAKVAALEAQQAQLAAQQAALEAARGELGSSRSRISLIEKELQETLRRMRQQGEQLERARYDLAASRYGLE